MDDNYEFMPAEPLVERIDEAVINAPSVAGRIFKSSVNYSMMTSELLPINWGVFIAAHEAGYGRVIDTLSFAAATLITEAAGAVSSANLLANNNRAIGWAHRKLEQIYPNVAPTGKLVDFMFTVFSGTVKLNIFKQMQDPERSRDQNMAYSLAMGIGNTAVSGVGGWFIPEAFIRPDVESVGISIFAGAFFLIGPRALKRAIKRGK